MLVCVRSKHLIYREFVFMYLTCNSYACVYIKSLQLYKFQNDLPPPYSKKSV